MCFAFYHSQVLQSTLHSASLGGSKIVRLIGTTRRALFLCAPMYIYIYIANYVVHFYKQHDIESNIVFFLYGDSTDFAGGGWMRLNARDFSIGLEQSRFMCSNLVWAPVYPPVICYIAIENKPFVVDLPSQTRDFPKSYVNAYQRRIFIFFVSPERMQVSTTGKSTDYFWRGQWYHDPCPGEWSHDDLTKSRRWLVVPDTSCGHRMTCN